MAIPALNPQDILEALKFIDKNGVPDQHQSTKYLLVTEGGKSYPPKYVIAVANHIANGKEILTDGFTAVEAKNFLQSRGFTIETKQEKFVLTITANAVHSTDSRFTMDNLVLGDGYKPLATYFQAANGKKEERKRRKNENKISNRTLPSLACQIFEKQLDALSAEEKENFPICQYTPNEGMIRRIYSSESEYKKTYPKAMVWFTYSYDDDKQFVFDYWNLFSTIHFVQECLKRFGSAGDQFVLEYREKDEKEIEPSNEEQVTQEDLIQQSGGYKNPYSATLIESKNVIFHGAPGTGKTYLAKEIAADIISGGYFDKYELLTDAQKQQVEFVQFHPSYDYTDFVEGLRPEIRDDGSMGFRLRDGVFKAFVDRARKNYENSKKTVETIEKELSIQEAIDGFFSNIVLGANTFKTISGNEFTIVNLDDNHVEISIPGNAKSNRILLDIDKIKRMLESDIVFDKLKDVQEFFGHATIMQVHAYYLPIYKEIKAVQAQRKNVSTKPKQEELKKYIFIIDEINRGEISKIFGELFFAVDPGYRGEIGAVKTQYANLHADPNEKFYIPENVYIIGTMNDIDRSVDSFDFAMRRRFRFIELKADEGLEMLDLLHNDSLKEEAIKRMTALNKAIAAVEDLNEDYQIGASYFLKLKVLSFDQLWADYLKPLLQEYIRGMYDEGIMDKFEKAYRLQEV